MWLRPLKSAIIIYMKNLTLSLIAALAAVPAFAQLVPAALFNDNMVLQRDKRIAVWGQADAQQEVTVSFAGTKSSVKANAEGKWRVDLPAMPADRTPREMTITSSKGEKIVYRNVLVGEVWLCGGQSNMTFSMWPAPRVFQHAGRERNGYYDVMLTDEPEVRGVQMNCCWSHQPKEHGRLNWFAFTPGNGKDFSAAAWHYAIRLYRSLKIPVGVIESAWGGSCIETWIPPEGYEASEHFKSLATRAISTSRGDHHQEPRACWNSMIYPLAPYGIRGAIWYQGCTNRGKWKEYYEMLGALRTGWSRKFECPDMPFYICQITPYGYTTEERDDGRSEIREEMERFALDHAPQVGMVTLTDVGEVDNIHPGDKRTVGTRLAAMALNRLYGFKQLKCDAPLVDTVARSADGKKVTITFKNVEGWCLNGTYKLRFELAGADGKYVLVDSKLGRNTVELAVPAGMEPQKVAYLRKSCVHGFLKNEAGLPLGPFRKDLGK